MKKLLLFLLFIATFSNTNVKALELSSKYAVLYNLTEDKIIYEQEKDVIVSVASLTKIMTTLVAIENITNFNENIILKEEMFQGLKEANAYVIGLRPGQKVTYNDLLYGMFLASGADATRAIAISIADSEEKFVELMNKKVHELGLSKTNFQNTVGLDAENHYSTVNEVATILKYAMKNEKFKEIFTTEIYTFSDGTITVSNSMKNTAKYYEIDTSNILGAKTGYTGDAGRCLASIAYDKENKIAYLLVTTKADTVKQPILDAKETYDYYFKNYKYHNLINKNDLLVEVKVKYSKEKSIKFFAKEDVKKYLKNDYKKENIKIKYIGKEIITPITKENEKIGRVEITYNGEIVDKIDIMLSSPIKFSLIGFIIYYKYFIIGGLLILIFILIFSKKKNMLK